MGSMTPDVGSLTLHPHSKHTEGGWSHRRSQDPRKAVPLGSVCGGKEGLERKKGRVNRVVPGS